MFEGGFGIASMIEKRAAQRFKVLKGGKVALEDGLVACIVRNMSSTGVAVEFPQRTDLPPTFTLVIERDRLRRRCRPVWSNARRAGLAFCQEDARPAIETAEPPRAWR